ncbi:hypothetical protein [Staphylococcus saccharolyticus]
MKKSSIKYKKYDEEKGSQLLQISIIVAVVAFAFNLIRMLQ